MSITIVNPYFTKKCVFEVIEDYHDEVERQGYVSPDKKIQSFLQNGTVPATSGGSDYELQQEELECEIDSDEYIETLTREAENFDKPLMPQFVDKLSASEILNEADKYVIGKEFEAKEKKKNAKVDKTDTVIDALKKIESKIAVKKEEP